MYHLPVRAISGLYPPCFISKLEVRGQYANPAESKNVKRGNGKSEM
ncbi:predicted protein [Botrytis cinerea T4]|uniref:Uncharacterized protein n=1 Tax=Botryotinia fuckeliana (strain T4) TaxID=999810 RepID=G2XVB5_BOTF4|nr:predicted protein [Botrytis cinerea T4]